jgi:hypothetical protein
MNNEKFKKYTIDTISLLKELARKAKLEADNEKEVSKGYAEGVIMGYYSIITILKHEAFAFCIDQKELGLADIKPDLDLLGLGRNSDVDSEEDNWGIDVINEEKIKGYLIDSMTLLKEQAREAKKEVDNPKEGFEEYNKGQLMAYCTAISTIKNQAHFFCLTQEDINLADIEPERDLV